MSNAYWPIDGRALTSISTHPVPWDTVMIEKRWLYSSAPPGDDPRWRHVGVTDDHEHLWAIFDRPPDRVGDQAGAEPKIPEKADIQALTNQARVEGYEEGYRRGLADAALVVRQLLPDIRPSAVGDHVQLGADVYEITGTVSGTVSAGPLCDNCGRTIKVMAFRGTGYCSDYCRKALGVTIRGEKIDPPVG